MRIPTMVLVAILAAGVGVTQASATTAHETKATKHPKKPKAKGVAPADARANPLIQGNQSPPLPAGTPGKVAVIASGVLAQLIQPDGPDSLVIPVVIRNNTTKTQSGIQLTALAKVNGKLVGTGTSQVNFQPLTVKPGQIALGYAYFQSLVPTTAIITYTVTTGNSITYDVNLPVTASNLTPVAGGSQDLIGTVKNTTKKKLSPGALVYGICFNAAGQPTGDVNTGTSGESIAAGATVPFSDQVSGDNTPCTSWLVTSYASTL
jgi:hypothetical protein